MCMKLGMKEIYKVYFNEYVDKRENLKLRRVEYPHKSFTTYALDLRPVSEQPLPYKWNKNDQKLSMSTDNPKQTPENITTDLLHAKITLLPSPLAENIPKDATSNTDNKSKHDDQSHMIVPSFIEKEKYRQQLWPISTYTSPKFSVTPSNTDKNTKQPKEKPYHGTCIHLCAKCTHISDTPSIQKTCKNSKQQKKCELTPNSSEKENSSAPHINASEASIAANIMNSTNNESQSGIMASESAEKENRSIQFMNISGEHTSKYSKQKRNEMLSSNSNDNKLNLVAAIVPRTCHSKKECKNIPSKSQPSKASKKLWLLETEKNAPSMDSIKNHIINIEDKKYDSSIIEKLPRAIESLISQFLAKSESSATADLINEIKEADKDTLYLPSSNLHLNGKENIGIYNF